MRLIGIVDEYEWAFGRFASNDDWPMFAIWNEHRRRRLHATLKTKQNQTEAAMAHIAKKRSSYKSDHLFAIISKAQSLPTHQIINDIIKSKHANTHKETWNLN